MTNSFGPPRGCGELNMGPMEEQSIVEPSLPLLPLETVKKGENNQKHKLSLKGKMQYC